VGRKTLISRIAKIERDTQSEAIEILVFNSWGEDVILGNITVKNIPPETSSPPRAFGRVCGQL
jgi:hypothetical protein